MFCKSFFDSSTVRNIREASSPQVAAALAAVGDFDAAFRWSEAIGYEGQAIGEIALTASKCLDREAARRFVQEAAERFAKMQWAEETYHGLSDLAEAQARLGDVDAARRSARAIGEKPSRAGYDMTDGQPFALIRVARVQHEAGDIAGAIATLRDAFRTVSDHPQMRFRDGRYLQVAHAQIANGDTEGAVRSIDAMEKDRHEPLAALARAYAAAGDEPDARAAFARALADPGLSVKDPPGQGPELAEIQAMAGDVPGALKTVRSIGDQNSQSFALQKVVSARATAGDVAGAASAGSRRGPDASRTPSGSEGTGGGT